MTRGASRKLNLSYPHPYPPPPLTPPTSPHSPPYSPSSPPHSPPLAPPRSRKIESSCTAIGRWAADGRRSQSSCLGAQITPSRTGVDDKTSAYELTPLISLYSTSHPTSSLPPPPTSSLPPPTSSLPPPRPPLPPNPPPRWNGTLNRRMAEEPQVAQAKSLTPVSRPLPQYSNDLPNLMSPPLPFPPPHPHPNPPP